MKRTVLSLLLILFFILGVVVTDLWFMTCYAKGMNEQLDLLEEAEDLNTLKVAAMNMDTFFKDHRFWAHRFVPTGQMDELEMLLHKLNAYIASKDEHEITATIAEIRARVNLLYSTDLYHWYHPIEFRIE